MAKELSIRTSLKSYAKHSPLNAPLLLGLSFLFSVPDFMGIMSPYPVALMAAVSGFDCVYVMAGALFGFLVTGKLLSALSVISGMLLIMGIKLFVSPKTSRPIRVITAVASALTILFLGAVSIKEPSQGVSVVAATLIGGSFTFLLGEAFEMAHEKIRISTENPMSAAVAAGLCACLVSALSGLSFSVFNLGIILAAFITLFSARKLGFAGAAAGGAVCAFGLAIGGVEPKATAAVAAAGIVSGLLWEKNRITQIAAFLLTTASALLMLGSETAIPHAINLALGAFIYLAFPEKLLDYRIKATAKTITSADYRDVISQKLNFAADTIEDIRTSIDKTAAALDRAYNRDISWVTTSACDKICSRCPKNLSCWGTDYSLMTDAMGKMVAELRRGKRIEDVNIPQEFSLRCERQGELLGELNASYRRFIEAQSAKRRISDMRWVLTEQLSGTKGVLNSVSRSLDSACFFNEAASTRLSDVLSSCGISSPRVGAVVNSKGRMSVEAYGTGVLNCSREYFCESAISALGVDFDLPDISFTKKYTKITMYERSPLSAEFEITQYCKGKNKVCGDYFDSFTDENGVLCLALSDGMGHGVRARVDSAFACGMLMKLLRAGLSMDESLKMVNSSMAVKSADESFATLDVCRIDLYTGEASVTKAGAAPTYVKSRGRVARLDCSCPPAGAGMCLDNTKFSVSSGDIILMLSDGIQVSEEWLVSELKAASTVSAKELSRRIAATARLSSEKNKDDDISVVAVKIIR